MIASQNNPNVASAEREDPGGDSSAHDVWMYDPWCRTPWYTGALTKALQTSGQRVRLVCPDYPFEPGYFLTLGLHPRPGAINVAAHCGAVSSRWLRPVRVAEYGINVAALCLQARRRQPQIVHQQQCVLLDHGWKAETRFLRWCRARGSRIVYTAHNLLPHERKASHAETYSELYRLSDAVICHDAEAALALQKEFGVEPSRIHVIPHGPLFAEPPALSHRQSKQALAIEPDRQVYLALGVLSPYKGLDVLLEAWAEMVRGDRRLPRPLLVIAGTGAEKEKNRLRRMATGLGLDGTLRLDLDYVPAGRLPVYMQSADVLLYPYRKITTSGALLTGLNYCKPIIASDLPAFRNFLFPNLNALTVTPGDPAALKDAMDYLREDSVFARFEAGCRNNRSLQAQWKDIADRTAAVYATVLH